MNHMNKQMIIALPFESTSEQVASLLANCLKPPATLSFSGDIGAGKTTIIRAMLRAFGVTSAIKSPTFSLVESYSFEHMHVHHFDLYRIQDEAELDYIGFRDYFSDNAICCIEWPEHGKQSLQHVDLHVSLSIQGSGRRMQVDALSPVGERILDGLAGASCV